MGARRGLGPALDRRRRGPPQPRQLDRLRQRLLDRPRRAGRRLRRRARRAASTTRRPTPAACAARSPTCMINVFGPRARRHELRRHPARQRRRPVRACSALQKGEITPAQFVDLNEKIGGLDVDAQCAAAAHRGRRAALRARYRSGRDQLGQQPRPGRDHRPPRPRPRRLPRRLPLVGDPRPARARARPLRQPGHLGGPGAADRRPALRRPRRCSRWTAGSRRSSRTAARDRCPRRSSPTAPRTSGTAARRSPPSSRSAPSASTSRSQTRYGTPATVAGESIATDTNKCALKPLRRADYYPIVFTPTSGRRLQRAFPIGVCDWSRPGPEQQGAIPWQTYQEADGSVIHGGRALEPAPLGSGWTSFD